jgi:hypothetical protein
VEIAQKWGERKGGGRRGKGGGRRGVGVGESWWCGGVQRLFIFYFIYFL